MGEMLWKPSDERIRNANMTSFIEYVNKRFSLEISDYGQLYEWSITDIASFWAALWDFGSVVHSEPYSRVVDDVRKMPGALWFDGAKLNFAENLLRYRDDLTALIFRSESGQRRSLTYGELYRAVARLSVALRAVRVESGDRVVGLMPNLPETVIAMLAATSLGAIWSSCSPDFGEAGVLDRFRQIEPKVMFVADGYYFKGRQIGILEKVRRVAAELPSLRQVVVVPFISDCREISSLPGAQLFSDFADDAETVEFVELPFSHPVYIMYSSGTTGLPKCLVQSAGGVLLQHLKELALHTDLRRDDTIFYYTTCGWMMWNWLVSSLALGAKVLLYDGSPFYPAADALWRIAQEEGITVFGTSAKYLSMLEKEGVVPKESYDLGVLKTILSTGSPLSAESFRYVYSAIKEDVQLSSISGGTDINGCFALGNPLLPVYEGELQCRGLGMRVEAFDESGRSVVNQKGELVCTAAFPSMPLYFWNDPENKRYFDSYFARFPGVWTHGDFIEINDRGGVIVYGRSDATLNPGGVRIGTAEIYRQVDTIPEVVDSIVVGQDWKGDVRVVLFVKLAEGIELDEQLLERIKRVIRDNTTPRHVPAKIIQVPDIPYTINMKKVELAVRRVIHGEPVTNREALLNPESLSYYENIPALAED
ncbi:MAG: acetoacetate--CoA ligase [Acidobacteriota bacterium]|nr:acetoacetate--CoA ligase [Blastocatellia bacterium]MDW8413198.1 acetoacetate--CoA ligase [Acidobacteriota bacterium]